MFGDDKDENSEIENTNVRRCRKKNSAEKEKKGS
jgi:hypothetical protein